MRVLLSVFMLFVLSCECRENTALSLQKESFWRAFEEGQQIRFSFTDGSGAWITSLPAELFDFRIDESSEKPLIKFEYGGIKPWRETNSQGQFELLDPKRPYDVVYFKCPSNMDNEESPGNWWRNMVPSQRAKEFACRVIVTLKSEHLPRGM